MISLREIEREFHADGGSLGRGKPISKAELDALDTTGYTPYAGPLGTLDFPIYACDGAPTGAMWRGFYREENGVFYCVSIEYYNI